MEVNEVKNKTKMKAIWNNKVVARSNDTIVVEGNHYFPQNSLAKDYFSDSTRHTTCPYRERRAISTSM